ncbi:PaaI family thioesterase [Pontibacter oryzae]|uniref:PaaI family thioesterase n=1 Tax=Pontibacter oryzae TaxID=2304593 RepID=A0A399SCY7_9BACT|nr:PaaI family thioesterase [Pontibacter oryzae]RIJ41936.1 PaaI family thioesterase [Pontibacter oryzae]
MELKDQIAAFLKKEFPQTKVSVEQVGEQSATVRHTIGPEELRPGGTVSGPVMMAVADVALYVAILGEIGLEALTVTTSLNFNFLRKPSASQDIIGVCKLLKLGKRLAVGEVSIYSDGEPAPVAHAVGTYSIPPR